MAEWEWNGGVVEWRNGGMVDGMAGLRGMTEWRSHEMAEWWNGEMAGWLPTYFIYGTRRRHRHLLIFYSIDTVCIGDKRGLSCHNDDRSLFWPIL
jgi:hypothetical protein